MHIFHMSVTYLCWKYPEKALRGVDFTKYALSTIIGAVVTKIAKFKTLWVCKKKISASNFFMHIFIMSVIYLQSAEKIQWKL